MADYWQQKDTSRPEDEWQLPFDHDHQDNPSLKVSSSGHSFL